MAEQGTECVSEAAVHCAFYKAIFFPSYKQKTHPPLLPGLPLLNEDRQNSDCDAGWQCPPLTTEDPWKPRHKDTKLLDTADAFPTKDGRASKPDTNTDALQEQE